MNTTLFGFDWFFLPHIYCTKKMSWFEQNLKLLVVLEKWCEIVCQLSLGADIHYFLLLCSHSLPPLVPSNSSFLWGPSPSSSWPWSSWWGKPLTSMTFAIMTMIIVMRKTTHVDDVFIRERLVGLVVLCVLQENLQIVSSFTRIIILIIICWKFPIATHNKNID